MLRENFTVEYHQGRFQLGPWKGERLIADKNAKDDMDQPWWEDVWHRPGPLLDAGKMRTPNVQVLSLQQQLANLKTKYAEPDLLEHPLLPPYSVQQVEALEAEYGFQFTPLLRLYLLHISRQYAVRGQR